MAEVNSLLHEIQNATGCLFLSDLHNTRHLLNAQAGAKIMMIPFEQYSPETWNEGTVYVTGK